MLQLRGVRPGGRRRRRQRHAIVEGSTVAVGIVYILHRCCTKLGIPWTRERNSLTTTNYECWWLLMDSLISKRTTIIWNGFQSGTLATDATLSLNIFQDVLFTVMFTPKRKSFYLENNYQLCFLNTRWLTLILQITYLHLYTLRCSTTIFRSSACLDIYWEETTFWRKTTTWTWLFEQLT